MSQIDDYFRNILTKTLSNNGVIHEICHSVSSAREGSDLDSCLEISFAGYNPFVDALAEANADLLVLGITEHTGQLLQVSDSFGGTVEPEGWSDEHILGARLILSSIEDFDFLTDLRDVATLTFLRFRRVLLLLKKTGMDGRSSTIRP